MKDDDSNHRDRMLWLGLFFSRHLDKNWRSKPVVFLNGMQIIEAIWPMNLVFRAHQEQIRSLPYSAAFERDADAAIALLSQGGTWTESTPSAGVWRVLQERHVQSIVLAAANAAAGNAKLLPLPQGLPTEHRTIAAMIFLQWAMVLPQPPSAVPGLPWPADAQPANLLRH